MATMLGRVGLFAGLLAGFSAISETSSAQSVVETASKWGLLGTWRVKCGEAASDNNGSLSYVIREKKLFHDRQFSKNKDSNRVVSAKTNPDGSLEVVIDFAAIKQVRQVIFIKHSDGVIQVTSSKNNDTGEYTIQDGKFKGTETASLKQIRCP